MMLPMDRPGALSRRVVLASAASSLLSACSIRLERNAPAVPGLRTQAPPPDTAYFRQLVDQLAAVVDALSKTSGEAASAVRSLHEQQRARVVAVAASAGIPLDGSAASSSTTPATSSVTSSRVDAPALELAGASSARLASWQQVSATNRPMFLAVAATQLAGAARLGAHVDWQAGTLSRTLATTAAPAVYRATYVTGVATARAASSERGRFATTLSALQELQARVMVAVGESGPAPRQDYALTPRPDSAAARTSLVATALADLVTTIAAQSSDPGSGDGLDGFVHLWAQAISELWPWQRPLPVFPGLTA